MKVYLGIDIGTTSIKLLAVTPEGKVVHKLSHPLELSTPHPAWAEQNPESWWKGVLSLLHTIPPNLKVTRIGLSGQMHTLVPLDARGAALRGAILWCDQRSAQECLEATQALGGEEQVIAMTGNPFYPGFTLPKMLWLRKHEPDLWAKTKVCLIAKDYIAYRLTGNLGSEPSDASGSAMYDVTQKQWNTNLLNKLNFDTSLLPPLQNSWEIRGNLRPELVKELGWNAEVIAGGADNAVSALGIGIHAPGDCMVSIGTSGTVAGIAPPNSVPDSTGKLHFFNHVLSDASYYMGVMLSAAASLNWFKEKMAPLSSWAELENNVAQVPIGAYGMLFLPYLQGERTPHRNPNARGVLYGLTTMSDTGHIFRAVMEGITYGFRDSFELLKKQTAIKRVVAVGGGAKNETWRQMLADNFNVPIALPEIDEGGAYGAAMLAAMKDHGQLESLQNWLRLKNITLPKAKNIPYYDEIYSQFRSLYQDLKFRFDATAAKI